jgi:chromosomal replication initiator protein
VVHRGQTLPATVPFPENAILRILKYVARHRDVPFTWLLSDTRQKQVVLARHMAMWIASVLTERSLSEIGMRCNRDHTTVLSGLKRIEHLRTINPAFRAELDTLREGTKTMLRETGYAPHKG